MPAQIINIKIMHIIDAPLNIKLKNLKRKGAFSTNPVLFLIWNSFNFPVIIGPIILKKKYPPIKNNDCINLNFKMQYFFSLCWVTLLCMEIYG
jgi:hypothetical protein